MILGSLPGDESIMLQQYYANRNNDFWKLISHVIGDDITKLRYDGKLTALLNNKIGLWDVFSSANREGSLDSDIIDENMNDFEWLKNNYPDIELICFNGKKAGKNAGLLNEVGYKTETLPSSSGANRRIYNRKEIWKSAINL